MRVGVVIPWRPSWDRVAALEWCLRRWHTERPGWRVWVAQAADDGAWCKAVPVGMTAGLWLSVDVVVMADADVWCPGVGAAVDAVGSGRVEWAVPHDMLHRLDETSTAAVLAGAEPDTGMGLECPPYRASRGGGMLVMSRRAALTCRMDPRFVGWGGEDDAQGHALGTMCGPCLQVREPLWHLWHAKQPKDLRASTRHPSTVLLGRYRRAAGDRSAMAALLAEVDR